MSKPIKQKLFLLLALVTGLLIVSCQAPTETVEVTRIVEEQVEVEVTRVITETIVEEGETIEVTRIVTEIEEVEVPVEMDIRYGGTLLVG